MNRIRTLVLIGIVITLVLAAFVGCSMPSPSSVKKVESEPVQTDEPMQTESSQQTENAGPVLNILSVAELPEVDASVVVTSIVEITAMEEGNKFVSPWVFIKNTGAEAFNVDMFAFTMTDTDGNVYESSVYTPGNFYVGADVLPGGLIEGPVYFEVPVAVTPYALQIKPDLAWNDTNLIEIDLAETDADPGSAFFNAEPAAYFADTPVIALGTPYNFDDKLSITVNGAGFIETNELDAPNESYHFYQVELTVENLTAEELDVTLDYMYKLYSPGYNHLIEQIPLPYADNELFVITMPAGGKQNYVLTFEAKQDSTENYLFLQDFFEENAPVLFALS